MPISINYDPEQNVLFADATESISVDDMMSYYSEVESMNINPQHSVLADFSKADIYFNYYDINRMASRRRKISSGPKAVKIAIVAKSDLVFGIARMYGAMINDKLLEANIFRDRAKALQWLGISDVG